MNNLIAAIDLGTTKTVVAVGQKTNLGVKILAYEETPSRGIKRGRVENVKFAYLSLNKALAKIEEKLNMKVTHALIGIAGQDIKCFSPEAYQIQRKDFEELISPEEISQMTKDSYDFVTEDGYKVFYSVPQSYNVDNYMSVSEPIGMIGRNIVAKYRLFAGKENSRRMVESTLGFCGITPLEIVLEPVASAKAVLTQDEMEVGSVMVDIGGGTTDVIVYTNNIIRYAGIIPFGGNSITQDICTGCGIAYDKAEYIKVNYGCCFSDYANPAEKLMIPSVGAGPGKELQVKVLSKIIQARMEEILEAVQWHVEQSGYKDAVRSGIVFTGGGSKIKNLTNLADFVTGYEARLGTPNSFILDPGSCNEAKDAKSSTAAGMLIHAFQRIEEDNIMWPDCLEVGEEFATAEVPEAAATATGKKAKGGIAGWFKGMKEGGKKFIDGRGLFETNNEV